MEISPRPFNTIKTALSSPMTKEEAERFLNLDEAMKCIKEGQLCWQAPYSVGVHAAVLHFYAETDADMRICQNIVGYALEPLEAFHDSVLNADMWESRRLLFHARFALGFLLVAKGEKQRSKDVFGKMAAAKPAWNHSTGEFFDGPQYVQQTGDVYWAAWLASTLMQRVYEEDGDYEGAVNLARTALAFEPHTGTVSRQLTILLDRWCAKCEKEDSEGKYEFPTLYWIDVFATAGDILTICQEADSSEDLPNQCRANSPQFWAWEFGQLAARPCLHSRWQDGNPFEAFIQFSEGIKEGKTLLMIPPWRDESCYSPDRGQDVRRSLIAVLSLVSEFDRTRDWKTERARYVCMWNNSYTSQWVSLSEIGPESDLYWAMRIGFADKILEVAQQNPALNHFSLPPLSGDIGSIRDIVSRIALQQMKQDQTLDRVLGRLPPAKREIGQRLQRQLSLVWSKLPPKVVNALVKAENYYCTDVNDDDAKVWFYKAVEAAFAECFVAPLSEYMHKTSHGTIAICFPSPRGVEHMSLSRLRKVSLGEWGDVLPILVSPSPGLSSLGTAALKEFAKAHLGGPRLPDLRPLSDSLRKIQQCREGAAHYQEAGMRSDRERWQLEQMRNLTLGIDRSSVVVELFQLLAPDRGH